MVGRVAKACASVSSALRSRIRAFTFYWFIRLAISTIRAACRFCGQRRRQGERGWEEGREGPCRAGGVARRREQRKVARGRRRSGTVQAAGKDVRVFGAREAQAVEASASWTAF